MLPYNHPSQCIQVLGNHAHLLYSSYLTTQHQDPPCLCLLTPKSPPTSTPTLSEWIDLGPVFWCLVPDVSQVDPALPHIPLCCCCGCSNSEAVRGDPHCIHPVLPKCSSEVHIRSHTSE